MNKYKKFLPFVFLFVLIFLVYWRFFISQKIPMPGDLMNGVYYPWLDYKWGYPIGVPVINPSISDIFSQFFPWKYLIVELYKNKTIPLWNQYSFSGTPLMESYHSGVFFPFNVLLFLPKYFGWGIFIFGQTFVAAIGMFLLLKFYVKNQISKIIGAIVFALSGLMTTWVEFGTGVWAVAMLPWIFYFINNFLSNNQLRNLFFLTLVYTCLLLAGHAQLTLYSSLLIGIYLLYLLLIKKTLLFRRFIIIILFIFLGIGLSSLQLIPTYYQVSLSVRLSENSYIKALNNGLTPWYDFIRLYIPDFFGNPSTYNYWGDISYYENSPFLATLSLVFLLPFFFKRFRKGQTGFWFTIFIISLALAASSPLTNLIYNLKLPFLTYSSASRIFFITSFCAGLLVAIGSEIILKDKQYQKAVKFTSITLLLTTLLALLLLKLKNVSADNFIISLKNCVIPSGILLTFIVSLYLKIKHKYILVLLLFLIFFDLFRYFNKFNPFINANLIFPKTPAIEFLESDKSLFRISRLNHQIMTPNTWIPYHLSSIEGYDPMALDNYSRYFNRLGKGSYLDNPSRFSEMGYFDFNFINAMNVKYLLTVENDKTSPSSGTILNHFQEVFRDKSTVIYKNPQAKDRIYFVPNVITVPSKNELVSKLDDKNFDPSSTALIVYPQPFLNKLGSGTVNIHSYQANSVNLTTYNKSDGFLVFADSFHPGWKAYIDNQPTPVFEVNGALKGIYVREGTHNIKMEYWPNSFDIGLKTSIICAITLFILVIYFIVKNIW